MLGFQIGRHATMNVLFRASFVAVLLAGVVLGGVGSSAEAAASRLSVRVGGVCVREGARDRVAGKRVVCVLNAKKQLRWRFVKAKAAHATWRSAASVGPPHHRQPVPHEPSARRQTRATRRRERTDCHRTSALHQPPCSTLDRSSP